MDVKIRNVKQEEWKALADIEAVCFPPSEAAQEEEIKKRIEAFPENFFVAEADGKVVGFVNGCTTDQPSLPDELYHEVRLHKPDGDYQTVFGLSVLPKYRGKGIAGQLLEHMSQACQRREKKGIVLTCKEHLIGFYESHGYVNYGKSDSQHGNAQWYEMKRFF